MGWTIGLVLGIVVIAVAAVIVIMIVQLARRIAEQARTAVAGVEAVKRNTDELADFSKETEHCSGKFAVAADSGAKIAKEYDAVLAKKPEWSDRTSYVIAPSGDIVHVYSNLDPKEHVHETLDAVKALEK